MNLFFNLLLAGLPCCLLFVLIGAARFSFIVGLVERPLALAMIAGFVTDQWSVALPIGITLELLWQDVIAMGTVIHPFGGMAFLLLFPFARTAHFVDAGSMLLPLILAMLCAQAGSWLEQRYRIYEDRFLPDMEAADPHPEKVVYQSILRRAGMHAILYAVSYTLLCGVVCTLLALGVYPIIPDLSWTFV